MTSIRRLGLAVASAVTAAAVAGVFVAQGYLSAQQAAAQTGPGAAATTTAASTPETIYVRPAPSQQVIQITQTAPPAGPPPVIHVIVPSTGGENEANDD